MTDGARRYPLTLRVGWVYMNNDLAREKRLSFADQPVTGTGDGTRRAQPLQQYVKLIIKMN